MQMSNICFQFQEFVCNEWQKETQKIQTKSNTCKLITNKTNFVHSRIEPNKKYLTSLSPVFALHQGCQIFLGTTNQNGKNIPNDHKIYQLATKYTKMEVK
jgi:gamma-glutamyltranspeptidase